MSSGSTNQPTRRFYEAAGWAHDGGERVESLGGFDIKEARYTAALD